MLNILFQKIKILRVDSNYKTKWKYFKAFFAQSLLEKNLNYRNSNQAMMKILLLIWLIQLLRIFCESI